MVKTGNSAERAKAGKRKGEKDGWRTRKRRRTRRRGETEITIVMEGEKEKKYA